MSVSLPAAVVRCPMLVYAHKGACVSAFELFSLSHSICLVQLHSTPLENAVDGEDFKFSLCYIRSDHQHKRVEICKQTKMF